MTYDPDKHHRRSIRLRGYDYAQPGAYFITICIHDRQCLLGAVIDRQMHWNGFGRVVKNCWSDLSHHYAGATLDSFVVMPNHIHGIVRFGDAEGASLQPGADVVGAGLKPARFKNRHGLPEVIRGFKTFSSRRINQARQTPGLPVWQRNYYERVIRNEDELHAAREYVLGNPARWSEVETS